MTDLRPHVRLGRIVPRFVLALCLLDAGMRLLPVDPWTFRGWEAAKRFRPPGAAFEPGRRYHNERAYGDLAAMGNLRERRFYRPETFTTDALGFRTDDESGAPAVAMMVGDSFTVGSGVRDRETLTAHLTRLVGRRIYNAGGIDPDPDRIRALAQKVPLHGRLVIHEYHEHTELPDVPPEWRRRLRREIAGIDPAVGELFGRVRGFFSVSPLRILCQQAMKRLENDRLLPNPHARRVVVGRLQNGDSMLFLAAGIDRPSSPREPPVSYWRWLRRELGESGLDLLVVLVPSKFTVYEPFLAHPRPAGGAPRAYLRRVEEALQREGIATLDLTSTLTAAAAEGMARRLYLYLPDDIHWTPAGTLVAAEAVRKHLGDLREAAVDMAASATDGASAR
jgi:hypothetical protein